MIGRVLMTADAVGGVWTYALELARGLRSHRIDVFLAVLGPEPDAAQLDAARAISGLEVEHHPCKLEWMPDPWRDVENSGEWLLDLESQLKPDIVHLNGFTHGALSFRAPKIVVAHSCVLTWWLAVHGEPAPPEWNEYREKVTRGIHSADLLISPSRAMYSALSSQYGEARSALLIPNGCNPGSFNSAAKENFLLTAGRLWDPAKNLEILDRIAPSLPWPVYAAGEGGRSSAVKRLGVLNAAEMRGWYARAAIYTLPARYEPFGLSVLEAALSSCALVLGDIPSLRENWDGAALFAEPDSGADLRRTLQSLIESDALREQFQRAALQRAQSFTSAAMTAGYLAAYRAVRKQFAAPS